MGDYNMSEEKLKVALVVFGVIVLLLIGFATYKVGMAGLAADKITAKCNKFWVDQVKSRGWLDQYAGEGYFQLANYTENLTEIQQ